MSVGRFHCQNIYLFFSTKLHTCLTATVVFLRITFAPPHITTTNPPFPWRHYSQVVCKQRSL